MIVKCYSMYDNVTGSYSAMQQYVNSEHAKREYATIFSSVEDKPIIKDLSLYQIGEFNLTTGEFEPKKEFIANAVEVLEYGKE